MLPLYNISLFVYGVAIRITSLFNHKVSLWVKGRKDIFKQLSCVDCQSKIAWFHCASLGEFEQARPIIEKFKTQHSTFKLLITFFSPSGYEIRKNYELADYVFYLPLDSKTNAKRFIDSINPQIAIFVKYEFWYHYLSTLHKKNIPTYIVSANFRKEQIFFQWYGGWYRQLLKNITHIFVQNEKSQQLLFSFDIHNTSISGDTRFDRVYATTQNTTPLPLIEKFKQGKKLLIGGSTWEKEETLLIQHINNATSDLKYIIAPHDIKEANINRIFSTLKVKTIRLSELHSSNVEGVKVLIIDSIGILANIYQYADIAFVGGAFGKGLHNILEPATFGMPIFFGPKHSKFPEAKQLIDKGGAFCIHDLKELEQKIKFFLRDEMILRIASEITKNFVMENRGATERILKIIQQAI